MSPKIADRNRTDTNSYTCDDLYWVYIFHKLSSQHSICMSCSDVCKLDSSQFIHNCVFVLYIIRVTPKHHCRDIGFLSPASQNTAPVTRRQHKVHPSSICCPSVHIIDKQITGSLPHFSLLVSGILKLFGCLFSFTGKFHFWNSGYEFMKHTLRTWSPD